MALDEFTACEAVATWAGELLGIDEALRFTTPHLYTPGEHPDVVAVFDESAETDEDDDFPLARVQQRDLAIFAVELSVMLEMPANQETAHSTHDTLKGYAKTLREAKRADKTLGSRVQLSGRRWRAAIEEARELPDEAQGPALVTTIRVAESISP